MITKVTTTTTTTTTTTMMKIFLQKIKTQLKQSKQNNSGIVALQVGLVIGPLVILFFYLMELAFIIYISASIDMAMSEAMRQTATATRGGADEYRSFFKNKMKQRMDSLPFIDYRENDTTLDVLFCRNLADIINNTCLTNLFSVPEVTTPIAYFSIRYKYKSVVLPVPEFLIDNNMSRKGIYIMEYERVKKS